MTEDRLPPQDLAAEQSVLGSCAVMADALDAAAAILTVQDFYSEKHQMIWSAMVAMRERGNPVDAQLLAEELEKRKQLAEVGGVRYILEVLDSVPHAAHVVYYANIVRERARRRGLVNAATEVLRNSYDPSIETDALLADLEAGLHRASEMGTSGEPVAIGDILADAINSIGQPQCVRKIPTTFARIDGMCGGFQVGGLTIIGARPGEGKTSLALSIAIRAAEGGTAVLFVSCEQPKLELAERMISIYTGVSMFRMQHGKTTREERDMIVQQASQLDRLKFWIDDSCRGFGQMTAMIRSHVRRKKTQMVVIDYLGLVEPDETRGVNREQQVSRISRGFKRLAMQQNIAVVLISQLNRQSAIQERRPRLQDLRESGAIEQDGDLIWLVHRPNHNHTAGTKDDNFGIVEIAKQRNGPTGDVALEWRADCMQYREITDPETYKACFDPRIVKATAFDQPQPEDF